MSHLGDFLYQFAWQVWYVSWEPLLTLILSQHFEIFYRITLEALIQKLDQFCREGG